MANKRKKLSKYFIAFLAIAFAFLAIGLGTLGSFASAGDSYELKTSDKEDKPSVIFHVTNPAEEKEDGTKKQIYCALAHIYLNVGVLYSAEGEDVSIRMERGGSSKPSDFNSDSSSLRFNATLENLVSAEAEEGKTSTAIKESQFNWTAPFEESIAGLSASSSRISSYPFFKLTAPSHSLVVNEVVFVGEKLVDANGNTVSSGGTRSGEFFLLPVTIESATYHNEQGAEEAKEAAGALIDAQAIPNMAQSTFNRFSAEEAYSLMSIAEMRAGGSYSEENVYHGDTVYNTLGTSILAFGTLIFGMSPFGLRIFPMLASFGVLMVGFYLARDFFKSEKAGLAFAILYALSNLSIGLGHLGTPLMIGVFFFVGSVYGCYRFYRFGMKKANFRGALPLILSGLAGAAAICVNGAYLIPMLAVAGLFAAGMVKQQQARRYHLDLAIAAAEEEEAQLQANHATAEEIAESESRKKVAQVAQEYRQKNAVAPVAFGASLVLGALFFSLIFLIPVYYLAVRLFDNPASPSLNIFTLAAKFFAGGFVGSNGGGSAWPVAYTLFAGTGEIYAVTSVVINVFAFVAAIAGIAFAIWRIVMICKADKEWYKKSAFYSVVIPLAGIVVCLITAAFAGGGLAFITLAYAFGFVLAAGAVQYFTETEGKIGEAAKIISVTGIALLSAWFLITAVFTFSIPLPASFMSIFG